jgi:hypothetical protein
VLRVLAGWHDRVGVAGRDGLVAFAGVGCAISGDAGDLLIGWNPVEWFGQLRRIAHVDGGELRRADFQCFLVDPNVDLSPDTPLRAIVLAGVPFTFAFDLDASAFDQKVERPLRASIGDVDLQGLPATPEDAEVGHRPVQTHQPQQAFDKPGSA